MTTLDLQANYVTAKPPRKTTATHGMSNTRAYRIWSGMRTRCLNAHAHAYDRYGGRGIKVCEEWSDFSQFVRDLGLPSPDESLDRIDNDGNYEPANCRWATSKTQGRNQRSNRSITVRGVTKLLCEWVEETGLHHATILRRIGLGWTEEEAVTTPLLGRRLKGTPFKTRDRDYQQKSQANDQH